MSESLNISELEGGASAKFPEIGDRVAGIVTSAKRTQQTDFDTGDPLTFTNGEPRMQTVIGLELADGTTVRLYAKGGTYEAATGTGKSMEGAIVAAVRAAGCTSIDVGAKLAVAHTGLTKPAKKGLNPAKLYEAAYEPPKQSVAIAGLFSDEDGAA
jgi:hypothetical protein